MFFDGVFFSLGGRGRFFGGKCGFFFFGFFWKLGGFYFGVWFFCPIAF